MIEQPPEFQHIDPSVAETHLEPLPEGVDNSPNGDVTEEVQSEQKEHLLTPANVMTAGRPVIGACAAYKFATGETGVTKLVIAMAVSDGEGFMARAIDKIWPGSGYGCTNLGKSGDPIADSVGFLEVAAGALKSPRVSRLGKLAVGIVLASEGVKSGWAMMANAKHLKKTGEQLVLTPNRTGKEATGFKFAALVGAALTHDLEPGFKRTAAGVGAVVSAVIGGVKGEKARRGYKQVIAADAA